MSDASSHSGSHSSSGSDRSGAHTDERPGGAAWQRVLYMIGFWFLGNIAFSLSILLGAVQFIVVLINGEKNGELAAFSKRLVAYVWECLTFITYGQEEKPFPFGKFPEEQPDERDD